MTTSRESAALSAFFSEGRPLGFEIVFETHIMKEEGRGTRRGEKENGNPSRTTRFKLLDCVELAPEPLPYETEENHREAPLDLRFGQEIQFY
jgi:hypothetical protein